MELFTATGKLKRVFFLQLEIFGVCTTSDTAHIDTIFKFLPHASYMGAFCLHRHPVSVMILSVGGFFAYFAPNARCTVTTDLLV